MKKSAIIKIYAAVIAIVVILILAALLLPKSAPVPIPTFKFLNGRTLTAQVETNRATKRETLFLYSFEADFNDIVADANSELSALGYINSSIPKADPPHIKYYLYGKKPIELSSVYIIKNHKIKVLSIPENSDYKTPTQYERNSRNGWITVEIEQSKQRNRFIVMLKNFVKKFHEQPE